MWTFKKEFNIKGREITCQDDLDRVFIAIGSSDAKFLTDKGFITPSNKKAIVGKNKNEPSSEVGPE